MKFFLLEWEEKNNPVPRIVRWTGRLDYHAVITRDIQRLPRRTVLYIESNQETVFSDVISAPFFLVSELVWDVMKKYDVRCTSAQIVLLDGINGFAEVYYMPLFHECDCLHEESVFTNDRTEIREIVLRQPQERRLPPLFRIKGIKKDYVIGRLDFIESILRRGAKGIRLKEVKFR